MPLALLLHEVISISLTTINVITLIVVTIGCLGVAATTVANASIKLWFPMPWFLLTSAIYYGFGPLLYFFGTPETIAYVDECHQITDLSLFRANLLTVVGIAGVILIYMFLTKVFPLHGSLRANESVKKDVYEMQLLKKVAIISIVIGIPIKIFLVLPRALGIWDVVLPGALEYFAVFSTLALVPLFLLWSTRRVKYRIVFLLLLCFEVSAAFVQLSKLEILKIAIVLILAGILRGVTVRRIALIGVALFMVYAMVLLPLVTYGRIAFNVMGLTRGSEATQLIKDFATGSVQDDLASILPGVQGWWSRLNYANAQAFAMEAYDTHEKGNTFELAMWTIVPRILYPNKPLTTIGDRFNELVTGNPDSKSAPGMFAEGYWNAGWAGLIIVAMIMALCYWGWERYTEKQLSVLQYQYLPVMWIGLFSAIQQDSWFVPSTLGIIPIAVVFHFLIKIFTKYQHFKKSHRFNGTKSL